MKKLDQLELNATVNQAILSFISHSEKEFSAYSITKYLREVFGKGIEVLHSDVRPLVHKLMRELSHDYVQTNPGDRIVYVLQNQPAKFGMTSVGPKKIESKQITIKVISSYTANVDSYGRVHIKKEFIDPIHKYGIYVNTDIDSKMVGPVIKDGRLPRKDGRLTVSGFNCNKVKVQLLSNKKMIMTGV